MTACAWCGNVHVEKCYLIKAIDYYKDGKIKRIEFLTLSDLPAPATAAMTALMAAAATTRPGPEDQPKPLGDNVVSLDPKPAS